MNARMELTAALAELDGVGYDSAWSMPASYYIDPEILTLEKEHLFGKEWICIGRADEVSEPGDSMAFTLCEQPLVAVRGEDRVRGHHAARRIGVRLGAGEAEDGALGAS